MESDDMNYAEMCVAAGVRVVKTYSSDSNSVVFGVERRVWWGWRTEVTRRDETEAREYAKTWSKALLTKPEVVWPPATTGDT